MRIVFIGPPGAGKGTQAERLASRLRIAHLSTGEMLREAEEAGTPVGRLAHQYTSAGRLVPDEVIIDVVRERIRQPDCAAGCLFDGFPRTIEQAVALDELLAEEDTSLRAVVELRVDKDELIERLLSRGRADDTDEVIRQRLTTYREQTAPVIDYYAQRGLLRPVDGKGTIDEVFNRIVHVIE